MPLIITSYDKAECAVKVEAAKYGMKMTPALEREIAEVTEQVRATTYAVHQYRHLAKVQGAKPADKDSTKTDSRTSMTVHNATFSTVPERLLIRKFCDAVQQHVFG